MKHLFSWLSKYTVVSGLLILLVACGGAEERKAKYLEKGKVYLAEKNYDKARIEFKNVLQIDPKFAEAYYLMGEIEETNKELRKALGNYKKAIELDPKHTEAKIKLAKIYVIAGTEDFINEANKLLAEVSLEKPESLDAELIVATIEYKTGNKLKAKKDLKALVDKDATKIEAVSLLSTLYKAEGEDEAAKELLFKGVAANAESIYLRIDLARLLAKSNDLLGAEKYLKQAVAIEPEKYSLQVAIASFYSSSNQIDKAESILRKTIEQDDEDVQRYLVLVEMLASRVSVEKADAELKKAIKNKPDLYELKFSQVDFYKKIGKRSEAKAVLKQIVMQKSYDIEGVKARNILAKYLLDEGDQKGAKNYVDEVIAEYPNNNDALLITSKLALADLDAVAAINGLRTVLKNDPKSAEASLLIAQAHELNNEASLAENELKKSIESNPINVQTHVNYARYLASKGRFDEATAVIDKALTYFNDSYDLLDLKLKIVATQGNEPEVIGLLDRMELANANKEEVNLARGQYYLSKQEMNKALEQFELAYQKSKDKYKPLEMITKTYLVNNKPDLAIQRLEKQLAERPSDAIANQLIGQVYLTQKKVEEARSKFKQAISNAETWFIPYSSLASTYLAEKNADQAISIYKGAIDKLKNSVPAQMQIAAIYERKKDYKTAMSVYQEILSEKPGNKLAANNLASLLLDYGSKTDVPKALELSKGFEKLNQPALQDTLGWAYAKSGDNVKAVEVLKPVVEKSPKIAIFRFHLGYALYHSGNKAAAKSHLEVAVSSDQNFYGKDEAKEMLKTI